MNDFKKWLKRYKKLYPESTTFVDTLLTDRKFPWDGGGEAMYRHVLLAKPAQYPFPVSAVLFKTLWKEFTSVQATK